MTTYSRQACPLCSTPAEYCLVDAENRKYFHCPRCTYFQISTRAERVLAGLTQARRDFYAAQAPTAPDNHLFVILIPDRQFRERSDDVLQASYLPKSSLPLN